MAEDNETNDHEMSEEKNGDAMETDSKSKELADYGLNESVVTKLEELFTTGKLTFSELDERALEALKEFPVDGALTVLKEFMDSSLEHVSNKSAYLCGIMKTYRQKTKMGTQAVAAKGPDEEKIKAILERTGYTLDVTTGQRKYGGPPPNWEGLPPGSGCEVFVGKIPKTIFEDELIPVFEKCGQIWDLRLMMDPLTGQNRGYAFITYCNKEAAQAAVKQLDNYEIKSGKNLKVNVSVPNLRLFVGNTPKSKSKEEIFEEFGKLTVGLTEVIIFSSPDDKRKNRGFCFLEYESHKAASLAKRKLGTGTIKVWGCDIIVDWADPQEEPDEETMAKEMEIMKETLNEKILNLKSSICRTEEMLKAKEKLNQEIEKKLKQRVTSLENRKLDLEKEIIEKNVLISAIKEHADERVNELKTEMKENEDKLKKQMADRVELLESANKKLEELLKEHLEDFYEIQKKKTEADLLLAQESLHTQELEHKLEAKDAEMNASIAKAKLEVRDQIDKLNQENSSLKLKTEEMEKLYKEEINTKDQVIEKTVYQLKMTLKEFSQNQNNRITELQNNFVSYIKTLKEEKDK